MEPACLAWCRAGPRRPSAGGGSSPAGSAEPVDLATLEQRHIRAVLESVGGDKSRAARLLGISRRTLERRFADWSATST